MVFFLFFAKLGQDAASALWMEESDMQTVGTVAGSLVNKADTLAVAHSESLAHTVLYLEGNMVDAPAAVVEELLHSALGACGLQELELHLTDLKESGLYLLVFYNFCFVNLQAENVLEKGQYVFDLLNGDAQVFNA